MDHFRFNLRRGVGYLTVLATYNNKGRIPNQINAKLQFLHTTISTLPNNIKIFIVVEYNEETTKDGCMLNRGT